jgi:Mg/Co/Ni transporter MgtE
LSNLEKMSSSRDTNGDELFRPLVNEDDSVIEDEYDEETQTTLPVTRNRQKNDTREYLSASIVKLYLERVGWLVALLMLQSFSSFILASFEKLLSQHIIISLFLTMLIGSGGNAGSQSTVIIIRGIATGDIPKSKIMDVLWKEMRVGLLVSVSIGFVGFLRVLFYRLITPENLSTGMIAQELTAITLSLIIIVFVSVVVGTLLPLFLHFTLQLDSANVASPALQVLMDIIGVTIVCVVCQIVLPTK